MSKNRLRWVRGPIWGIHSLNDLLRQAIRKGTEAYENERQRKQVEKRAVVRARINCTEHRGGFRGVFQFVRDFFCQNIQ